MSKNRSPFINYAYNFSRAFKFAKNMEDDDRLVVLEDDLDFVNNWIEILAGILEKIEDDPDSYFLTIYTPGFLARKFKRPEYIYSELDLDNYREFYACQGTVWSKNRALEFLRFNNAINLNNFNVFEKNEIEYNVDLLMGLFAEFNQMKILALTESLIDHIGHSNRLGPFMHKAHKFKGVLNDFPEIRT